MPRTDDDEILCEAHPDCCEPAHTRLARSGLAVCWDHTPSGALITTLRTRERRAPKTKRAEQLQLLEAEA